jgi:hypothetical protein
MTLRKWMTFASAAAMLAGVGACKDSGGGSSTGTRTGSEAAGRRGDTMPRARADAGSDTSTGTTTTTPSSPATPGSPTSPSSPTTPSSSGSSSDTKK